MKEQLLINKEIEINIKKSGNGIDDVVGKIFHDLRKEVFKQLEYPLIKLEAKEVYFDDIEISEKEEAFLFIFMKRVKKIYSINARIVASISYINIKKEES